MMAAMVRKAWLIRKPVDSSSRAVQAPEAPRVGAVMGKQAEAAQRRNRQA